MAVPKEENDGAAHSLPVAKPFAGAAAEPTIAQRD
jgi:hypothetical protein